MKGISELLAEIGPFDSLGPEHRDLIAGCGSNRSLEEGGYLFHEGEPADTFYVVRHGRVSLEIFVPARGPVTVETIGPGEVIGWSWLFEPYRWHMDARVVEHGSAIGFDGACLRGKCESDHDLGYELMKQFATLLIERMQATRFRLLDIYGHASAAASD
jgi:CRP/FNR family cyclic AMP-dependent transcriptional regulator